MLRLSAALYMHALTGCHALVFQVRCLYLQRSKNASLQKLFEKRDMACKTLVTGLICRDLCGACADENLLQQSLQAGMKLAAACTGLFDGTSQSCGEPRTAQVQLCL